jgi:hypothetical protein
MILVDKTLNIHLFINKFTSDPANLCQTNDDLSLPFEGFNEASSKGNHFTYNLLGKGQSQFTAYTSELPGTGVVRMGDLDLDGKLDLAVTVRENGKDPKTYFFMNQECDEKARKEMNPSEAQINWDKCRYFTKRPDISSGMSVIENSNIHSASFFDFHEMGYAPMT